MLSNIRTRKSTLTFLTYAFLALTIATTTAQAAAQPEQHHQLHRRDHADLKRLIRKRSPQNEGGLGDLFGLSDDESSTGTGTSTSATERTTPEETETTSATTSAPSTTASSTASEEETTSSSSSTRGGLGDTLSSLLNPSESESSSSSVVSTTSSTRTSTTESSTSSTETSSTEEPTTEATPPPENTEPVEVFTTVSGTKTTLYQSVEASPTQSEAPPKQAGGLGSEGIKGPALTAVIVIAASVGGIILFWTIFRKWKLSRSNKFDQRLQPIDWQPPMEGGAGGADLHRTVSNASSFHSGAGHPELRGYGATGHNGMAPLPEHDFTAGPAHVGGYADLTRGPSPPMTGEVMRGASLNHGQYDNNVPLHHQASYGQPQGGYSDYRY